MKKNIIYLLIAGCSLFLGACNDDDTHLCDAYPVLFVHLPIDGAGKS